MLVFDKGREGICVEDIVWGLLRTNCNLSSSLCVVGYSAWVSSYSLEWNVILFEIITDRLITF